MYMFALLDPWPYLSPGIFGNLKESALFLQVLKGLAHGLMAESFQACCNNKVF